MIFVVVLVFRRMQAAGAGTEGDVHVFGIFHAVFNFRSMRRLAPKARATFSSVPSVRLASNRSSPLTVAWRGDRNSAAAGVTGVQTCPLPIFQFQINAQACAQGSGHFFQRAERQVGVEPFEPADVGLSGRSEQRRGGSDWSSDVSSSDLSISDQCAGLRPRLGPLFPACRASGWRRTVRAG